MKIIGAKILIIRFSSIGDVLQTLSVCQTLHQADPKASLHVITQSRLSPFFKLQPGIEKVWEIPKSSGWGPLWALSGELSKERFTHVYDAHNNLRSFLLVWMLRFHFCFFRFLRRPVYRWRRLFLFRFRWNFFPQPFSGQMDQLRPLRKWGIKAEIPQSPGLVLPSDSVQKVQRLLKNKGFEDFIALAPSAAYPLKRWPREYFEQLIELEKDRKFVLLGGPEDGFLKEMEKRNPLRVLSLAGELSLMESAAVVSLSRALVSNDTGVMHMAEQLNHPCVALMGPAPFGFPSKKTTRVLERHLWCRPCSKHGQGPCVNKVFHQCLRDISPQEVRQTLKEIL